jgi:hypothetical protein
MPRYTTCPGFWGESEGQVKADTVAVDASRSEGRASHRVRVIPVQAVTAYRHSL